MKKHELNFKKDIKPKLKEEFNKLMENPGVFDLPQEDIEKIEELSYLAKRAGWKLFKNNAQAEFLKQTMSELAETIKEDLKEDFVSLNDKDDVKQVIKHPEEKKWHLEPAMVKFIKNLQKEEKSQLEKELAEYFDVEVKLSFGGKVLEFFQELWSKLEPIFSKMLDVVGLWGGEMLGTTINKKLGDNKVSNALSEAAKQAVEDTTEVLTDTMAKTHKGKEESEQKEEEAKELLGLEEQNKSEEPTKEPVGELVTELVEQN